MTQSEVQIQAVPASADTWTDVGSVFTVPAGVKRIKKIRLGYAPDHAITAISVRSAPVFRLTGSGLLEQSPHEFVGVFGSVSVVTTGGISQNKLTVEYDVDIPVSTGGGITAQVNSLDEAITAGTVMVNLFYDNETPKAKNSMSQFIDAAGTTSADAWTSVGTITVPQPSEGSKPTKIRKISLAVAIDLGTSAVSLRTAVRFRLTGSGIAEGGSHEFVGQLQTFSHCGSSASQGVASDDATAIIKVDIPISAGGTILVEHRFDVETPTASTVAVGLLYA